MKTLSMRRCAGTLEKVRVAAVRMGAIRDLVRRMGIRRENGGASVGALLDAIYEGKVGLVRMDEADGGVWLAGPVRPPAAATPRQYKDDTNT